MESSAFNPYAAPEEQTLSDLSADHLTVRKQYIHCESNIKSIAGLMILGGLLVSCSLGSVTMYAFTGSDGGFRGSLLALFLVAMMLAGFWQIYTGVLLRRLKLSARIPAAIACGIWILFVPIGTILGGVSLWYMLRPAASFVLSEEYAEVIRHTPEVTTSTSIAGWSLLIVVLIALGLALTAATVRG